MRKVMFFPVILCIIITVSSCTILQSIFGEKKSEETPSCESPVFSPEPGFYQIPQNVTITTPTEGAVIYYTTDGTDPDQYSSIYSGPIRIDRSTVIKAIAMKEGWKPSDIATGEFNIYEVTIEEASVGKFYDELSMVVDFNNNIHILCSYKDNVNRYLDYITDESGA